MVADDDVDADLSFKLKVYFDDLMWWCKKKFLKRKVATVLL